MTNLNHETILKIMVQLCVLLPHIHEVLGLILNLMVAILKFFIYYPSTLRKIMGQYLQQAKCCFDIPPNSSPNIILQFLDTGRFLQSNMKLTVFHSIDMVEYVLLLQVFHPFIHSSQYIWLCLVMKIGAVAWHCIPKYQFKQHSEVNQTFLCLINNQEACDWKFHPLCTLNYTLIKFILFLEFLILFDAGQLYVPHYNVAIISASHIDK